MGGSPVCGEDEITYSNDCFAFCAEPKVAIARPGVCAGDGPPQKEGPFINGRVTKQEINAFKNKHFKLVGKRGFNSSPNEASRNPWSKNPGNGKQNPKGSIGVVLLTYKGLEYVSSYRVDDIPDGIDTDSTEGVAVPIEEQGTTRRLGRTNRLLGMTQQDRYDYPNKMLIQFDAKVFGITAYGYCGGVVVGNNQVLTAA